VDRSIAPGLGPDPELIGCCGRAGRHIRRAGADFDGSGLLYRPTRRHARRVVEAFVVVDLDVLRILELEAGNSAASKARLDLQSEGVIIV